MQKKLAELLAANKARWIPAIAAFISGGLVQLLTSKGFQLPGDLAVSLSAAAALLVGWAFEAAISKLNKAGVAAIQDALPGIHTTGQANAGTVAMVERLVGRVAAPSDAPAHPLTIEEGQTVKRYLHKICRDRPELLAELRKAVQAIESEQKTPNP